MAALLRCGWLAGVETSRCGGPGQPQPKPAQDSGNTAEINLS